MTLEKLLINVNEKIANLEWQRDIFQPPPETTAAEFPYICDLANYKSLKEYLEGLIKNNQNLNNNKTEY